MDNRLKVIMLISWKCLENLLCLKECAAGILKLSLSWWKPSLMTWCKKTIKSSIVIMKESERQKSLWVGWLSRSVKIIMAIRRVGGRSRIIRKGNRWTWEYRRLLKRSRNCGCHMKKIMCRNFKSKIILKRTMNCLKLSRFS